MSMLRQCEEPLTAHQITDTDKSLSIHMVQQILQRLSKETKDYLKYWKYIDHELEMAPLIQVRNDGNHKYYRFVHE